jgi:hypothetical protein
LVIAGLMAASLALAWAAASAYRLALLTVLIAGAGATLAFMRWPPLGLTLAAVAGMVVPFYGPSGLNITMVLLALLLGLWLVDMFVRQRAVWLAASRPVLPLLCFVVVACLAFGVGQLRWFTFAVHAPLGAQLGGLALVVLSAGAFLLVANRVTDLAWLRRLTWVFLAMGAVFILIRSVLPELGLPTQDWLQRMGSVFYLFLVALAFSQAAFNGDLHPGWRVALGLLTLVTVYVLLVLKFDDKGGWVAALTALAAIAVARSPRVALLMAPVGLAVGWFLLSASLASEEYSLTTRQWAWDIMGQIIRTNPVLGLGFANYYWYTPLYRIAGYAVSFNSHNNYLDILAQTGVVGLACFLWFWWETGRLGWRLRRQVSGGFARAYVYAALGGLAGMAVLAVLGDWVLPFFYNVGLGGFRSSMLGWLFLGGLASLERMVAQPRPGR